MSNKQEATPKFIFLNRNESNSSIMFDKNGLLMKGRSI
ncbi:hypothetical protein [Methylomonas albis]|nr:hypothetical protein [Methylomonas albis]